MGLDVAFLALLNAEVTVAPFTGEDIFGNTAFGPARTEKAYVEPVASRLGSVRGAEQEGRVVKGSRLIMDFTGIKPGDKITLPGGTITYVTEVVTDKDEVGADLYQSVTVSGTERG